VKSRTSERRFRAAVVAALLTLGAVTGPFAQSGRDPDPEGDPTPPAGAVATTESDAAFASALVNRVEARWIRRQGLVAQGIPTEVSQSGQEMLEFLREEGIGRLEPVADAAVLEGRQELQLGNLAAAGETFALASKIDPQQPAARWGEALTSWRMEGGVVRLLAGAWTAVWMRAQNVWTAYHDLLQFSTWLLLALILAGIGLVAVLLLKHGGELAHEVSERLPRGWDPAWRRTVSLGVLLAPVALLFLGPWALLIWAAALALVTERPSRHALYAWLVVLALAVPAAGVVGVLTGIAASPAARVAVASAERSLRPDLLAELTQMIDEHPSQPTWKVLAARHLSLRHPERAIQLLRDAAAEAPRDARVRILLGNVFYRAARYETAGVEYRAAAELDPEDAIAWFNLARVRLATFQFTDAEDAIRRARELSKRTVSRLEQELPQADVADPEFGPVEVVRHVVASSPAGGWRAVLHPTNEITLAALATLLVAMALRFRTRGPRSIACPRCGYPTCPRCAARVGEDGTCFRCGQLLGRREGLDPESRKEQALRIERHLTRRSRLLFGLHTVWPGMSLVYEGRVWPGLAMATAWAFLVLGALFPDRLVPIASAAPLWPPGLPLMILAILFWIVVQLPRLRPQRSMGR